MSLAEQLEVAPDERWRVLLELQEQALAAGNVEGRLDGLLEAVGEVFGADRTCLVMMHGDGSSSVIGGRGPERALTLREREEVSKTVIRAALSQGEVVRYDPMDNANESIAELGIVFAVAAPIRRNGDGGAAGVLYLDIRDRKKVLLDSHVQLAEAAARLFAFVFDSDRAGLIERREHAPTASPQDLDALLELPGLRSVASQLRTWLASDLPLLLTGESGVGKTVIATSLAQRLGRQPVVRATLGSSDDLNTLTSELFGHERGAFSGAHARRAGLVELADGGTLILDEVLCLPAHAQQLLLDFCQFGSYRPLGYTGQRPKRAEVHLIASTNGDLLQAIAEGTLRRDLYHRLAGAPVHIPALRERREDIPALTERVLRRTDPERAWRLSVGLRRALLDESFDWPGNVRQLEFVVRLLRARALAEDPDAGTLEARHLEVRDLGARDVHIDEAASPGERWSDLQRARDGLDARETALIDDALGRWGGVVARAARELGVQRTSLLSRMRTLGIERPRLGQG